MHPPALVLARAAVRGDDDAVAVVVARQEGVGAVLGVEPLRLDARVVGSKPNATAAGANCALKVLGTLGQVVMLVSAAGFDGPAPPEEQPAAVTSARATRRALRRGADGMGRDGPSTEFSLAHSITQGDAATTFALDAAQRRAEQTTVTAGSTTTVQRHYTDSSDNPGWATMTTDGSESVVSRYVSGINGDLAATVTGARVSSDVVDPLGSIATTLTIDGVARTVAGLGVYDEHGNAITSGPSTGAVSYGWLGGKEGATDSSGLVLMGVRLYNSVTGLFTTVDPVGGGNETVYGYPNDPVNRFHLDGLFGMLNWLRAGARAITNSRVGRAVKGACDLAWGVVATAWGSTLARPLGKERGPSLVGCGPLAGATDER